MSLYSGTDGELLINGRVAAKVRNWSFTQTQAVLPAQSLGDTDAIIVMDVRSITGSCTLFYYLETPNRDGDVSTILQNSIRIGRVRGNAVSGRTDELRLRLRINTGTSAGRFIEMWVAPTSVEMASNTGEVTSMTMQFQANGTPTEMTF